MLKEQRQIKEQQCNKMNAETSAIVLSIDFKWTKSFDILLLS